VAHRHFAALSIFEYFCQENSQGALAVIAGTALKKRQLPRLGDSLHRSGGLVIDHHIEQMQGLEDIDMNLSAVSFYPVYYVGLEAKFICKDLTDHTCFPMVDRF